MPTLRPLERKLKLSGVLGDWIAKHLLGPLQHWGGDNNHGLYSRLEPGTEGG